MVQMRPSERLVLGIMLKAHAGDVMKIVRSCCYESFWSDSKKSTGMEDEGQGHHEDAKNKRMSCS